MLGEKWANYCSSILNTSDPLYEIVSSSDASGYWIASPCASENTGDMIFSVGVGGVPFFGNQGKIGIRPVVCLKSGVSLIANDDGSVTLK